MGNSESTEDHFDRDTFRCTTLQICYSDNRKLLQAIDALQPQVKVLAIDSRKHCPDFLTSYEFYSAIQRKHNVFLVDVGLNEGTAFVDERIFKQKLFNFDKHLIIQCGTLAHTRVFVMEPGMKVQILDLNSPNTNEAMTKDELINKLKNKSTFGISLLVDVAKQGLFGEFHDEPGHHRTLRNASFAVEKAFGRRDTLMMPIRQQIMSEEYCTLMDYAVLHDDFLTVRLLSSHTWELFSPKHEELSTLEIAAKRSSPLILATLIGVDLPIPSWNIKLSTHTANLLRPNNYYGHNTPLLTAVKAGRYDNVDFFIRCGMDVNVCNGGGKTCLWHVVASGKWYMAKYLVERGARIYCHISDLRIALLESILGFKYTFNHNIVNFYDAIPVYNAHDVNVADPIEGAITQLHYAAAVGNKQMVDALLERKAEVDATSVGSFTPLHFAAIYGHVEIVQALLERNANVDAINIDMFTPLHCAANSGDKEIVDALLEKNANIDATSKDLKTPLHLAALNGHKEIVNALLKRKPKVDATDKDMFTPLHFATSFGHEETVVALLEGNANVDAVNKDMFTPLHFAAINGNKEIVNALLERNVNVDAVNKSMCTPMHLTAWHGHKDIVRALLERNANADAVDENMYTPLHLAAWFGNLDFVNALLEGKANVNTLNMHNFTPLHFAAQEGHKEIVHALLKRNANVDAVSGMKFTPLHLAAHKGHKEIASALLEGKAKVNPGTLGLASPGHHTFKN